MTDKLAKDPQIMNEDEEQSNAFQTEDMMDDEDSLDTDSGMKGGETSGDELDDFNEGYSESTGVLADEEDEDDWAESNPAQSRNQADED